MGKQTIAEKVFSTKCGRVAHAGDIVIAEVDHALLTDASAPLTIEILKKIKRNKVKDPKNVSLVIDHYVPTPNNKVARLHQTMRKFCRETGCNLYEMKGISHQILPELGHVVPGDLIIGADSHTCTYGAFNAFASGVGSTDIAVSMVTGNLWFIVPSTIKIQLDGRLPQGTVAKDVILWLAGKIGSNGATYKAIEYTGRIINEMSIDQRMTISNMSIEIGAKAGIMPYDEKTEKWLSRISVTKSMEPVWADKQAIYDLEIVEDLSNLSPQIACPHRVDNICSIEEVEGIPINMAVLGTCTNGRYEDLAKADEMLSNYDLNPNVRMLIIPASNEVYLKAIRDGIIERFILKGAVVLIPCCGPCCGTGNGIPSDGENVISTANRNFIGRMGNINSNIYLGSVETVVASAIKGQIYDHRKL